MPGFCAHQILTRSLSGKSALVVAHAKPRCALPRCGREVIDRHLVGLGLHQPVAHRRSPRQRFECTSGRNFDVRRSQEEDRSGARRPANFNRSVPGRTRGLKSRSNAASARFAPLCDGIGVSPACAVPTLFLNRGFKIGCLPEPSGASAWGRTPARKWQRQPRYESIGSKSDWPDRTPQGTWKGRHRDAPRHRASHVTVRTIFPGLPSTDRWPPASCGFYAARPRRQRQRRSLCPTARLPAAPDERATSR